MIDLNFCWKWKFNGELEVEFGLCAHVPPHIIFLFHGAVNHQRTSAARAYCAPYKYWGSCSPVDIVCMLCTSSTLTLSATVSSRSSILFRTVSTALSMTSCSVSWQCSAADGLLKSASFFMMSSIPSSFTKVWINCLTWSILLIARHHWNSKQSSIKRIMICWY